MTCRIIQYGSPEWQAEVSLRQEVLRKPLGLVFTPSDLAAESEDLHIGCFDGDKLVGCCILSAISSEKSCRKVRQVAVAENKQQQGVGKLLMQYCENWCSQNEISKIILHARQTAVPFYLKLNYIIEGDEFLEVGILHSKMFKKI